jgi:hypothetical protein
LQRFTADALFALPRKQARVFALQLLGNVLGAGFDDERVRLRGRVVVQAHSGRTRSHDQPDSRILGAADRLNPRAQSSRIPSAACSTSDAITCEIG